MMFVLIAGAVILVGAIFLVILGLRDSGNQDALQARLAEFAERGEAINLEEIELSQPITQRVIYPVARRVVWGPCPPGPGSRWCATG